MAERRKQPKRKKEAESKDEVDKPSKAEYEVAKYLKNKLPPKKTTLLSHKVEYFIASKAIDLLLDSKWATVKDKKQKEPIFTTRDSIVDFMDVMLRHKFFHRAKAIIVKKEPKKKKDDESSAAEDTKEKKKEKKEKETKDTSKEKETKDTSKEKETKEEKEKSDGKEKKKEKISKKVKLDMHMDQVFVDGNEPFVWIYDPIPIRAWLIGAGLVIAAIAICLFPLWPRNVRNGVYYLSILAAAFLFFIIGLAVLRLIVFTLVWVFTFGKHHLWLLPNLTEDVGFFESFWPLYKYEYKGEKGDKEEKKKKKKDDKSEKAAQKEEDKEKLIDTKTESGSESDSVSEHSNSKSIASSSDRKNSAAGENGFEILDSKDLDEATEPLKEN